ncbi:UNVERIFIED_CONTAM: hypothetical protein FKN15_018850 [Acipenser sinensis]
MARGLFITDCSVNMLCRSVNAHRALGQRQVWHEGSSVNILYRSLRVKLQSETTNSILSLPRARRDYWEKLAPASGRPFCSSMSHPDSWGVTKGHADLVQQKEATSEQQLKDLFQKQKENTSH